MKEYIASSRKRKTVQLVMALVFLAVLTGAWFYPLLGFFIPLCMVLGIGIALFNGRKWCDWYCPRGSFLDTLMQPLSSLKEIPGFFKKSPLRIAVLSFLMLMMTAQIIRNWPDPYKIGMFFVVLLTVTTALGIILAFLVHHRSWCCFCPIGSMGNWIGKKNCSLTINSELCTECKLCRKVCPIQIPAFEHKKENLEVVRDSDCLKCNLCVKACPKDALKL